MALFLVLSQRMVSADYIDVCLARMPLETILLELPKDSYPNWKEIYRVVDRNEGRVECCPFDQDVKKITDRIRIHYRAREVFNSNMGRDGDKVLDYVQEEVIPCSEKAQVTWAVIEENENDVLYEWILHKRHHKLPEKHEIARSFLTEAGFHTVGVVRKNGEMSSDERTKAINLLKGSARVVSYEEASSHCESLSLAERLDGLEYGSAFRGWSSLCALRYDFGLMLVRLTPPLTGWLPFFGGSLFDSVGVKMRSVVNGTSIDPLFEFEKDTIKRRSDNKAVIQVLKQSPTEVIYSYSYWEEDSCHIAVVRSFISETGYYTVTHKDRLSDEMKQEKILAWKEGLEGITIAEGELPHFFGYIERKECK